MKLNLRFENFRQLPTAIKTREVHDELFLRTDPGIKKQKYNYLVSKVNHGFFLCLALLLVIPGISLHAQIKAVQWTGLDSINGSSFSSSVSRLYGDLSATDFRVSNSWDGGNTSANINNSDNYMASAAVPIGARNRWSAVAKNIGIGAAYSDSNYVEFKVSPTAGTSFNATLFQVSAIMNSSSGDDAGRFAVYYSVDDDAMSFSNPMNMGAATLQLIDGTTETSGSSVADPIKLQNHADLQGRKSMHAGDYSFSPNITVNDGQTLTVRIYAWNANKSDKYLNFRNVVIANTDTWPNQKLTTSSVTDIHPTWAITGGNIMSDGGFPLNESGFSWTQKTYIIPSRNDRDAIKMTDPVVTSGAFSDTMKGLTPATTYLLRAYANNANGAAYGQLESFTTADSIIAKPTVTTAALTNLGANMVTAGGNITANGGGYIATSGVLYSTTLSTEETLILGSGATETTENVATGSYTSDITGLTPGTMYYVRAYASNADSTGYGAIVSFTTPLVDITTKSASNIASTTAISGGMITPATGGGTITASGVVAAMIPNPEVSTVGAIVTTENATTGSFTSNLSGLMPATMYYVRAYATIGGVTTYGAQQSFTTSNAPAVVLWTGLDAGGGSFSDKVSRLFGNVVADSFTVSNSWKGGNTTTNITNSDNYMSSAAQPNGQRNRWSAIAKNIGIGAAFNDSNYVEFKVSPAAGSSFNATLVQFGAIMNSGGGDDQGRLAVYYSVDDDANSFANPMNMGAATLKMFDGSTMTSGSSSTDPIVLQNHQDLGSKNSHHAGDYTFKPNIMVNDGQTLTVRVYAWNASKPDKYLNIRNIVIANTSMWPNQNITTNPISSLTPTSAISGGNIITDGGFVVKESGLAWTNKTYYAPSRNDKDGMFTTSPVVTSGSFSDTLKNLMPATTYYARAFTNTDSTGASYGNTITFTTPDSITAKPTVSTNAVTILGSSTASSGGNITSNGGGLITASGILFSSTLSGDSSLVVGSAASYTNENAQSGSYQSFLDSLVPNTTYYVRAYASNSESTGYGAILTFTTQPLTVVLWTGLDSSGGSFSDDVARLYGNITADTFTVSNSWKGGNTTANINNSDNYMSSAAQPNGQRNRWSAIAKNIGIGAAFNDSNYVEFKVAPNLGSSFNATLVQFGAIMNSGGGDDQGRLAVYYSVDNDANSFANPKNMGTAMLKMFDGSIMTSGSSSTDPIVLQNHQDLGSKKSLHAGDYSFMPNIKVNSGQTLTVRIYAWNASKSDKYLNIRNIVISNTKKWPNQDITTNPITSITPTSAITGGNITSDGGFVIKESGFAWTNKTYYAPSRNDKDGIFTTSPVVAMGQFSDTMRNLTPATTYYVRAFTNTDSTGAAYGPTLAFTTLDSITARPTVNTAALTDKKSASATSGGTISNNGGGLITASGILYSTTLSGDSSLVLGSTATATTDTADQSGSFQSFLDGLAPGTTYYVRAYASNSDSTGYGNIIAYTTPLLDITTTPAMDITSTTATTGGTITPNNGGDVTASGVIVSTTPNPDLDTPGAIITSEDSTTGSYVSELTGLTPGTTYYVVAYATIGDTTTTYGTQVSFTTEAVLPITLITFNAQSAQEGVVINWSTAVEQNVKVFEVERSTTPSGFVVVSGSIAPGAGSYSYLDKKVTTGGYYYRLKTTDIDGRVSYSNIVYVNVAYITGLKLSVYPNPTSSKINVIHAPATQGSTVKVLTMNGSVYLTRTMNTGNTQTTLDVSRLAAGTYFIVVDDHSKKSVIKFVKN